MIEYPTTRSRGRLGGLARAASLSSDRRSDIATKAAKARWGMDRKEAERRFWYKVEKNQNGCWLWKGARYTQGYGQAYDGKSCIGAHQLSYIWSIGSIPKGFYVAHLCKVKLCVNPIHLILLQDTVEELESLVRLCLASNNPNCVVWERTKNNRGYGQVKRNGTSIYVHRMAWEIANNKKVPKELMVLHRCDNSGCLNPLHLFLGTAHDNMQDMLNKRRHGWWVHPDSIPRGEDNSQAKLDASQVMKIRQLYKEGAGGYKTLARQFSVSKTLIEVIVKRRAWKHVP